MLEFDSSTNDLSLVVRAEPVDRYGNSVFYTEEDLTIEVIMEDGDVASHILEPPNYDEIFVVKKGVAVSFEVAFYYDGEPMIDSMVQVNVKNVGTSTISTQALLVTVLSSIATIIVIFVCFRRFVFKSDTSTLKSEGEKPRLFCSPPLKILTLRFAPLLSNRNQGKHSCHRLRPLRRRLRRDKLHHPGQALRQVCLVLPGVLRDCRNKRHRCHLHQLEADQTAHGNRERDRRLGALHQPA